MPTRYTTAEVAEAVSQHPERWRKVTRESALSLPVPLGSPGQEELAFFWYPVGGPVQNRVVGAPTFRVLASLTRLDDITFLPVGTDSLGLGVTPGTALGKPTIGGPVASGEIQTLKAELFTTLDFVLDLALAAAPVPDADKAAVANLSALYHRLSVIVLLPAYRALNPTFFTWLEQNTA
jgi:hypothetical protein